MPAVAVQHDVQVLEDTRPNDTTLPPFMVSKTRGFLPRMDPIVRLPEEFAQVESLLARMPIKKLDGQPGLLAEFRLGEVVDSELPDLTDRVDKYRDNLPIVNALYRDYSFLASAYLLEPCHERLLKGESYGLGRNRLPRQIARPIAKCAEISGFKPWMEYAGSYALFNYRLEDPAAGMDYSNLRLIRAFEHGLDPTSSEAGFVLVHVDMVKNSGPLVAGTMTCLDALSPTSRHATNPVARRREFNGGLRTVLETMEKVNATMETMWGKSKPSSYTSFRTFIFGITSQSMFPNGVVYEGVGDEKPLSFRGESGANDSMIPLMDNLLCIPMPDTPLTEILRDFRQYRPSNHRAFLQMVKGRALEADTRSFALSPGTNEDGGEEGAAEVLESRRLWLQVLNQVRDFRWRHWCFAREYIIKKTEHPTATGGSPILTWLPNQLEAVLDEMARVDEQVGAGAGIDLGEKCRDIMELATRQRVALQKEVDRYCAERGVSRK
ncbi:related to indoleamine 2,3-dioxygenase [Cephalotrichum gorgonifer]|uniref:Related to indoleamine 2,3-dioxygenase n=1 Tax=Cephalotrichum gorgonifer TaxID=2041049 RepID=A0AAE8SRQ4_9PEZI|nr:related to indoleamine 2,3-dioxygenase [Cephalotrichum gorgonifer]